MSAQYVESVNSKRIWRLLTLDQGGIYVHLDHLLFDLKYDPSVIEISVPRYFKDDDRIPVELQWHEKIEKVDAKKIKEATKKGKKKKKTDNDDEEKKKEPIRLDEKA